MTMCHQHECEQGREQPDCPDCDTRPRPAFQRNVCPLCGRETTVSVPRHLRNYCPENNER